MSEEIARLHQPAAEISEEALARAEAMIEQQFGERRRRPPVLSRHRTRGCPPVHRSECGTFVIRRMIAAELRERDRVGRAIQAEW